MDTYVMLSKLTPKGRQTLHQNPDRLVRVNKEIEQLGCKVLAQWAVLGRYDFITMIQAPNNETVSRLSVELGSRGTIDMETLPAVSTLLFRNKLKETVPAKRRKKTTSRAKKTTAAASRRRRSR